MLNSGQALDILYSQDYDIDTNKSRDGNEVYKESYKGS